MLGGIGVQEIVIILIVGLLVFGAARLPKIARSLGLGIKEFKKTVKGLEDDDEEERPSKVKYVPPAQSYQYPQYNYTQQDPNYQGNYPPGVQNPQGQYQPAPGQQPPGAVSGQAQTGPGSGGAQPQGTQNQATPDQMPNTPPNAGPVDTGSQGPENNTTPNKEDRQA